MPEPVMELKPRCWALTPQVMTPLLSAHLPQGRCPATSFTERGSANLGAVKTEVCKWVSEVRRRETTKLQNDN